MLDARLSPFDQFKDLVRTGRLDFKTVKLMAKLEHEFAVAMYPGERFDWANAEDRYNFFYELFQFYDMDYALFMAKTVLEHIPNLAEKANAELCVRQCEYAMDPSRAHLAYQLNYATNRCAYDARMVDEVEYIAGTEPPIQELGRHIEALVIVSCCGRVFVNLGDREEIANALEMMCERGAQYFEELSFKHQQNKLLELIMEKKYG